MNEEAVSSPDEHGGFEFGTWTFPPYLAMFERIGIEVKQCDKFVFTEEQCDAIVKFLESRPTAERKGKTFIDCGGDLRLYPKWHARMVELFKSRRVVYYCR
jgi:hypothetical protein